MQEKASSSLNSDTSEGHYREHDFENSKPKRHISIGGNQNLKKGSGVIKNYYTSPLQLNKNGITVTHAQARDIELKKAGRRSVHIFILVFKKYFVCD